MKKSFFLIILLTGITFLVISSCDKDEELSELVGTWEYSDNEQGLTLSISITFNSDNTGKMSLKMTFNGETETESGNFTWSNEGNILSITEDGETTSVKYSISGNKLTITEDGEDMVFTRK